MQARQFIKPSSSSSFSAAGVSASVHYVHPSSLGRSIQFSLPIWSIKIGQFASLCPLMLVLSFLGEFIDNNKHKKDSRADGWPTSTNTHKHSENFYLSRLWLNWKCKRFFVRLCGGINTDSIIFIVSSFSLLFVTRHCECHCCCLGKSCLQIACIYVVVDFHWKWACALT